MDTPAEVRECHKCGKTKALTEFVAVKKCKGGRSHTCKACGSIYKRDWYMANAEVQRAKNRVAEARRHAARKTQQRGATS